MFNGHGNVVAASVHVAAIVMKSLAKVRAFLTRTDFGWDQTVSICFNSCFEEWCNLMGHGSPPPFCSWCERTYVWLHWKLSVSLPDKSVNSYFDHSRILHESNSDRRSQSSQKSGRKTPQSRGSSRSSHNSRSPQSHSPQDDPTVRRLYQTNSQRFGQKEEEAWYQKRFRENVEESPPRRNLAVLLLRKFERACSTHMPKFLHIYEAPAFVFSAMHFYFCLYFLMPVIPILNCIFTSEFRPPHF